MNTPNQLSDTPRTDAAWAKTFLDDDDQCRAGNAATDMRDACATLERELAALAAERDQLRAALAQGQQNCDHAYDDLRAERAAAIARAESAEREAFDWKKIARYETARAERAEREVQRLKSDGAASAFVNMSCRASRAETDRNNLRADKARLDWLEKARPIAWALGSEECGEYWILTDTGEKHPEEAEEFATLRAAIDAAMKEGA